MSTFIIKGGKKLRGSVSIGSGKNATLAILSAALMVRGRVVLENMSHVEDVDDMLALFESIGVRHTWKNETTLEIDASRPLRMDNINKKLCAKMRISLLMLGALAAREKAYKLYKTGGCHLGERTIRPHMYALEALGVTAVSKRGYYDVRNKKLVGKEIVMHESGDTATENAIMAAVLAQGTTRIMFASANYMVQDLCHFLVAAGAKIDGIGTTTLTIEGVKKLHDVKRYAIAPDPVDAMAWISLAITTKSKLTIKNCSLDFLTLELELLKTMGQKFTVRNKRLSDNGFFPIVDITVEPSTLVALKDKLHGRPYPGLNIDNVPLFLPILTQAKGQTLVHDWVYDNRAIYYVELQKLGAKVILLDPHRVIVEGPSRLRGNEVISPHGIRPGMAILITMLAAKGTSILRNSYPIERGYEHIIERLTHIGADITRKE